MWSPEIDPAEGSPWQTPIGIESGRRGSVMYEGEKCFHCLARVVVEPVWIVSADGHLVYGNPRWHALTAIGEGQSFPPAYLAILHPDDRDHWVLTWQHALRTHNAYAIERRVRCAPNGPYLSQIERGQPVPDANGDVIEWVLTATPTQEESQHLIEGLRHSLVRKNEALIKVAHEMRSPLAPIASAVKLLERCGSDPVCVEGMRALIGRQVTQLTRLVEDLLDLGRLEQRQLGVRKEPIDLCRVLAAAVETVQPIITARAHQLTTTVLAEAAITNGDAGRLTQVLVNLLVNAAKFTAPGGCISVSLERVGAAFVTKVRDTGIGIPQDMLPRIFDAYVRLERGGGTGLGLGLALALEIVQLHDGKLTAHSEGVGKGSEFVVTLPAAGASP
jgi:signal transduction histidine kinase